MKKVFFLSVPALALAALAGVGLSQKVSQTKAVAYDSATTTYTETVVFTKADYDLNGATLIIGTAANPIAGNGISCTDGDVKLLNGTVIIYASGDGILASNGFRLDNVALTIHKTADTANTNNDGISCSWMDLYNNSSIVVTTDENHQGAGISVGYGFNLYKTSSVSITGFNYGLYIQNASTSNTFNENCSFTTSDVVNAIASYANYGVSVSGGTVTLNGTANSFWANASYSLTQTAGSVSINNVCWGNAGYTLDFKGGSFTFNAATSNDLFVEGTLTAAPSVTVEGGNVKLINQTTGSATAIKSSQAAVSVTSGRFEIDGFYAGVGSWGTSETTSFSQTGGRFCGNCSSSLVILQNVSKIGSGSYIKDYYIDDFKTAIDAVTCTSLKADITGTMNALKTDYDKIYAEDVDELDVASSAHENMNYSAVYAYYLRYAEANGWSSSGAKPLLASNNDNGTLLIGAISSLAIVVALSYCLLRHKRRA